jgi:hypothetical protein
MKRLLLALALIPAMAQAQIDLGRFKFGETVAVMFPTYNVTNGASITMTGIAVGDIECYKGSSITQRAGSDSGYALIDTDGIDIDGITGFHGFSMDTSDDTDAGFWVPGGEYTCALNSITVNSQTVVGVWKFELDPKILAYGTAQSGTSTTIVLANWVGAIYTVDSQLNGNVICIEAGTGRGQCQVIDEWDAAGGQAGADTATVPGWGTSPTSSSVFAVYAASQATVAELAAGLDTAGLATLTDIQTELASTESNITDEHNALNDRFDAQEDGSNPPIINQEGAVTCEVNTAFFAGSSDSFACILTTLAGASITTDVQSGDFAGALIKVQTGAQSYEPRGIRATTWDGANNELRITDLDRNLPATLSDGVIVRIY